MSILKKLLGRSSGPPPLAERSVLCSGCLEVVPESMIKIIPYFNDHVDKFVTTYRCESCWMEAMDDTAFRLMVTDDEKQIASVAEFFEANGFVLLEYRRGNAATEVKPLLLQLLAKMRN